VPTHRLGNEIEAQFREHGITARVFRGRRAPDPDRPGKTMCDDLEAEKIALELGLTVETAVCKSKDKRCPFYASCSYQAQKEVEPDVWIIAHQLLFFAQAAIGKVAGVVVDEDFWEAGYRRADRGLTLDEIASALPFGPGKLDSTVNDLEPLRHKLARAMRRQSAVGGVERRHLVDEGLTVDDCTAAIALEWTLKEEPAIWPGMPPAARRKAAKAAKGAKHIRAYDRTWRAARALLGQDKADAVSGRLFLDDIETDNGRARVVRTRGARPIAAQWRAPTFIMSATLPRLEILQVSYPTVEVLADIDATMPHVEIRQVLGAPVSSKKLGILKILGQSPKIEPPEGNRVIRDLRRAILHRHLELDRAPTLVVAQKAVAEWLRASGLPRGVAVEWFNNVAGLDKYRDVRLLITVGRTLPDVFEVENTAGALTGLEPTKTKQPAKGLRWYDRVVRGIRLKDGTGVAVTCDQHPDPGAEAVRLQTCEGELLQAIGRARGVNRTAETPLTIEIMADVVLPVAVDRVLRWNEVPTGSEVEMLAEGVWLASPADMAKCWPGVWPTAEVARDCLKARTNTSSGESPIWNSTLYKTFPACGRYQLPGGRQKWRTARFDLSVIPDPKAWLTERLGALAGFELTPACPEAGEPH
jgi:hypothetical protein